MSTSAVSPLTEKWSTPQLLETIRTEPFAGKASCLTKSGETSFQPSGVRSLPSVASFHNRSTTSLGESPEPVRDCAVAPIRENANPVRGRELQQPLKSSTFHRAISRQRSRY